jgi:tetratricopeptide (TPR) repeat protein
MRPYSGLPYFAAAVVHLMALLPLVSLAFTPAAQAGIAEAGALLRMGKVAEARVEFEMLLRTDPKNAAIHAGLGEIAMRERRLDETIEHFARAIALAPHNSRYHALLGTAYGLQAAEASLLSKPGLASKSRKALEKAVALDPTDPQAVGSLFTFYLVAPGILGGSTEKALKLAQDLAPHQPLMANLLEASADEQEKKWTEAEQALERAHRLDPTHAETKIRLGQLFVKAGQAERAFAHFESLAAYEPDNVMWRYHFGRVALESGQRLDDGLVALRACLNMAEGERGPPPADVHWRIGRIEERRGNSQAARAAYQAALDVDPRFRRASESLKTLK